MRGGVREDEEGLGMGHPGLVAVGMVLQRGGRCSAGIGL